MISVNDKNTGFAYRMHGAVIEEWDYYGERFATTLAALPIKCNIVFSVTHVPTGLAAVKDLQDWRGGQREFYKVVAKYGMDGVLQACARAYKTVSTQPWLEMIGPHTWLYIYPGRVEVWQRKDSQDSGVRIGSAADRVSATKLAHILNSLRHPPQLVSNHAQGTLPQF